PKIRTCFDYYPPWEEASKGHYTADARYPIGQWLRFDDASVSAIDMSKVLHDQAYVLFYRQISG
ncbi:Ubiquitin carboxyl-terminal hydrolase 24, partial [Sarracenia purpurea var. burkii]